MNFVVFANGAVMIFMAVLMSLVALLFPATAGPFLLAAATAFLLGASLALSSRGRLDGFRRHHTFLLTASVWLTAGLAAALPLHFWGLSLTDAVFEAISGTTTTGSTVMSGLDATPRGILFWRALLQWLGGIGFIVTGIALLPMMKVGGMQLFRTESSETDEKELGSAARFAMATLWVYAGITALCALTYLVGGMSPFDAVIHSFTTLSTGGYSSHDASFGHFGSPFLQWAGTLFMVLASLPFVWYIRVLTRGQFGSEQVRTFLEILAASILVLALWRSWQEGIPFLTALREVAFNVVSVVSSTGYATTDYTLWGPFAVAAFFFLTAVGGCTGSTAGGAKIMRWIILGRALRATLGRVRFPHGHFALRYEGRRVGEDVLSGVISYLALYMASVIGIAVILAIIGLDFLTALSGALTAVANVGPGIGPVIGPAGNFASLPDSAKWVLVFGMYIGRLEMLTVLVVLSARYWRDF